MMHGPTHVKSIIPLSTLSSTAKMLLNS